MLVGSNGYWGCGQFESRSKTKQIQWSCWLRAKIGTQGVYTSVWVQGTLVKGRQCAFNFLPNLCVPHSRNSSPSLRNPMFCLGPILSSKVGFIKGDLGVVELGPAVKPPLSHTGPMYANIYDSGLNYSSECFTFYCCLCQVCKTSGGVLWICAADKGYRKWHRKPACIATVRRLVRTWWSSPTWKLTTRRSWFEPPNVFSLRIRTTYHSRVLCR